MGAATRRDLRFARIFGHLVRPTRACRVDRSWGRAGRTDVRRVRRGGRLRRRGRLRPASRSAARGTTARGGRGDPYRTRARGSSQYRRAAGTLARRRNGPAARRGRRLAAVVRRAGRRRVRPSNGRRPAARRSTGRLARGRASTILTHPSVRRSERTGLAPRSQSDAPSSGVATLRRHRPLRRNLPCRTRARRRRRRRAPRGGDLAGTRASGSLPRSGADRPFDVAPAQEPDGAEGPCGCVQGGRTRATEDDTTWLGVAHHRDLARGVPHVAGAGRPNTFLTCVLPHKAIGIVRSYVSLR